MLFSNTTKILVNKYHSKLPKTITEIKTLPGVGDYTGNVLLALVYNQPRLALDGNVKRVFSRIFNKHEKKLDYEKIIEVNKVCDVAPGVGFDFTPEFSEQLIRFGLFPSKLMDVS